MIDSKKETGESASLKLWNPNAAANWSLIFTPAFGSYLHMLNWLSLGETERAAVAQKWFYVSIGMLVINILLSLFMRDSKLSGDVIRGLGFGFLLSWYFASARAQAKYVKTRLGDSYIRRPWGKVFGLAIASLCAYFVASIIFGLIVGIIVVAMK